MVAKCTSLNRLTCNGFAEGENMVNQTASTAFATVTFAVYDDTPIACQGDDDHRKIRVITRQLAGDDIDAAALRMSVALGVADDSHVQVWYVQRGTAATGD
jgi:hypothetical protein